MTSLLNMANHFSGFQSLKNVEWWHSIIECQIEKTCFLHYTYLGNASRVNILLVSNSQAGPNAHCYCSSARCPQTLFVSGQIITSASSFFNSQTFPIGVDTAWQEKTRNDKEMDKKQGRANQSRQNNEQRKIDHSYLICSLFLSCR